MNLMLHGLTAPRFHYRESAASHPTHPRNGQFRTPRHIIRMMVQMIAPRPGERIIDPAAGTCGFLVNAWQYLLETHTDKRASVPGWRSPAATMRRPGSNRRFASCLLDIAHTQSTMGYTDHRVGAITTAAGTYARRAATIAA
jgi:N-6 DNA Methylase